MTGFWVTQIFGHVAPLSKSILTTPIKNIFNQFYSSLNIYDDD